MEGLGMGLLRKSEEAGVMFAVRIHATLQILIMSLMPNR